MNTMRKKDAPHVHVCGLILSLSLLARSISDLPLIHLTFSQPMVLSRVEREYIKSKMGIRQTFVPVTSSE